MDSPSSKKMLTETSTCQTTQGSDPSSEKQEIEKMNNFSSRKSWSQSFLEKNFLEISEESKNDQTPSQFFEKAELQSDRSESGDVVSQSDSSHGSQVFTKEGMRRDQEQNSRAQINALVAQSLQKNDTDTSALSPVMFRKSQSEKPETNLPSLELNHQVQSERRLGYIEEEKKIIPLEKQEKQDKKEKQEKQPRPPKKECLENFEKLSKLGEGAFAKVYLIKNKSNCKLYALKKIKKNVLKREGKQHQLKVEIEVLERLNQANNPNIVRFYNSYENDEYLHLRLEYVNGGGFSDYLKKQKKLPKDQIRQFSAEIINILECMHSHGIVHRDMKPENLLLTDSGHLKCIDFGGAKILNSERMSDDSISFDMKNVNGGEDEDEFLSKRSPRNTFGGTIGYVSPEVLEDKECGPPADLWALGCIIYQMATGRRCFDNAGATMEIFHKIQEVEVDYPKDMDPDIQNLIQKLLVKEPYQRLGAGRDASNNYSKLKSHRFFEPFSKKGIDFRQIHLKTPPGNDMIMAYLEDRQLKLKLAKESLIQEKKRLKHDEAIILYGPVLKDCGWFVERKRRQLVLNSHKIQYIDPEEDKVKGEIFLEDIVNVELDSKSKSKFIVQTTRKYTFWEIEHEEHTAEDWVKEINQTIKEFKSKKKASN